MIGLFFSPKGNYVAAIENKFVRIWNAQTGEQKQELSGHEKLVRSVSFSEDEGIVCTTSKDETVKFWTVNTGEMIVEKKANTDLKKFGKGLKDVAGGFKKNTLTSRSTTRQEK